MCMVVKVYGQTPIEIIPYIHAYVYGKNVKILIIVVELQKFWQIKFGDLVKFPKFTKLLSYIYGITECHSILLYSTIRLSTQTKYVSSTILINRLSKVIITFTYNTQDDDTKHCLNTLMQYISNVFVGNNRNAVFQYHPTLLSCHKINAVT